MQYRKTNLRVYIMDYFACVPLVIEYYNLPISEIHERLYALLARHSKKELSEAIGINPSGFYCYFEGHRRICFPYFIKLMTLDECNPDYKKYAGVLKLLNRYDKIPIHEKKEKVRSMSRTYGFPALSAMSGVQEATLHFYISKNCKKIPFDKYVCIITASRNETGAIPEKKSKKEELIIELRKKLTS